MIHICNEIQPSAYVLKLDWATQWIWVPHWLHSGKLSSWVYGLRAQPTWACVQCKDSLPPPCNVVIFLSMQDYICNLICCIKMVIDCFPCIDWNTSCITTMVGRNKILSMEMVSSLEAVLFQSWLTDCIFHTCLPVEIMQELCEQKSVLQLWGHFHITWSSANFFITYLILLFAGEVEAGWIE